LRRLATSEGGFGLVELLIAMTVMVVAIMAIVAAFSSGMVAVTRASHASTAATLADKQMEAYRAVRYDKIALAGSLVTAAASPYAADAALVGDTQNGNFSVTDTVLGTTPCSATPVTCLPVQSPVTGPDGAKYRIDSYIVWTCAVGNLQTTAPYSTGVPGCPAVVPPCVPDPSCKFAGRPQKRVTVVVRDWATPTRELFRETSTFDQATG
jgi:Tfp pilus assembly protein PilV